MLPTNHIFRYFIVSIICFTSCASATETKDLVSVSKQEDHMGSIFQITAVATDENLAEEAIVKAFNEIVKIEKLISSWDENSQTSNINKNAGIQPVKVNDELLRLIVRSKKVGQLTNGIFDISFASLDKVWQFDGSMKSIPDEEDVSKSVAKINYQNIQVDENAGTVFLKEKGMKIGFGGIGKGYAANRCKQVMIEMGIESGVVNAGGDLITWGAQKNGKDWTIGIVDPARKESALSYLKISDMAVVTSGNYERFIEFEGKKYCHIINPKTGWPAEALNSVTIVCPDAELADALATSVFIMGVDEGLALVNQLKDVECFIIDDQDQLHHSENISLNYYEED